MSWDFDIDTKLYKIADHQQEVVDDYFMTADPFDPLNESKKRGRPNKPQKKNVVDEAKIFLKSAFERLEELKCHFKT